MSVSAVFDSLFQTPRAGPPRTLGETKIHFSSQCREAAVLDTRTKLEFAIQYKSYGEIVFGEGHELVPEQELG